MRRGGARGVKSTFKRVVKAFRHKIDMNLTLPVVTGIP